LRKVTRSQCIAPFGSILVNLTKKAPAQALVYSWCCG
jgi:hypothetical protein